MYIDETGERQQQLYSVGEDPTKLGDHESLPKVKVVLTIEKDAYIHRP